MRNTFIRLLVGICLFLAACSTVTPDVKLLGMTAGAHSQSQPERTSLRVFLEVVNPGDSELSLSGLRYQLHAASWQPITGEIALRRSVAAYSSAVIEVPVVIATVPERGSAASPAAPTAAAVRYSLRGRLFGIAGRLQRSWQVQAVGRLDRPHSQRYQRPLRVRIAERQ